MATRLTAFATGIHSALADAGISDVDMRVGMKEFSFHNARRRVCWLEPGGKLTAPLQAGGREHSTNRSPACKVREPQLRVFVYGGDAEATEQLFEALVTAICVYRPTGGTAEARLEMPNYRWVTEEETKAGNVNRTDCIELTLIVRWPVLSEIKPLREITGTDDTCGTISESGSTWTVIPHG